MTAHFPNAWADLHAEFAHEARLDRARHAVREDARHITPAQLDAAIATLKTGDAFDRWTAEHLEAQQARAEFLAHEHPDQREGEPLPDMIGAFVARVWDAGWQAVARVLLVSAATVAVVLYGAWAYANLLVWLGRALS